METFKGDYSKAWQDRWIAQAELWRLQQDLALGQLVMNQLLETMINQANELRQQDPHYWENIILFKKSFEGKADDEL